jgi:hypothetical protein
VVTFWLMPFPLCERPYLDGAARASGRDPGRELEDEVVVVAFDQVDGAKFSLVSASGPSVLTVWSSSTRTVVARCGVEGGSER